MAPRRYQQDLNIFLGRDTQWIGKKRKHSNQHDEQLRQTQHNGVARSSTGTMFGKCPLCDRQFPLPLLLSHAPFCNGDDGGSTIISPTSNKPVCPSLAACNDPNNRNEDNMEAKKEESATALDNSTVVVSPQNQEQQVYSSEQMSHSNQDDGSLKPWWRKSKSSVTSDKNPLPQDVIPHSCEPVPGLFHFEDFITEQEEGLILAELDGHVPAYHDEFLPWKPATFNGKHRGKRWGVHCNLRDRRVSAAENPLPHFFTDIILPKLQHLASMQGVNPNEANAIDYRRQLGDFLHSHVDDRQLSREVIANLSLAGDCFMLFCNQKGKEKEEHRVLLKRRTLQVLTGKARYDYSHGIRNQDFLSDRRVSVTMRESPLTKPK